ncbi:hypothetical protein [Aquimarina mytili]|uniref:Uncharacterized protein n=1 Tax=Aquimarina mytili TaxID=874423 RepID=A0A937D817_9FLAO|nr:hypothetical protein [Aquimarina mytili]MBL0686154.1 hypothetical protein [Aquimarina mytili]
MRLFLLLGSLLLCFGCKTENTSALQDDIKVEKIDSLSKEKIKSELLKISPEAEKSLESFEDFQNLRSLMHTMHDANAFYAKKYADSADILVGTFEENLSEDLNVNTINSRITVLSTESALLAQLSKKKRVRSEEILGANTRLIKAYNSLVIQLNELSLAIPENIEKELLKDLEDEEN